MNHKLKEILESDYAKHFKTLKEISRDGEFCLSNSQVIALSCDDLVLDLTRKKVMKQFKTPDAMIIRDDGKMVLIEFKNQSCMDYRLCDQLKLKGIEGILSFGVLLKEYDKIDVVKEVFSCDFIYLVVYSAEKTINHAQSKGITLNNYHISRSDHNASIMFDLMKYEKSLYHRVQTVNSGYFDDNIARLLESS